MSKDSTTLHPVARAFFAIGALGAIVVAGNMLVSSLGVGHKTLDLTENKVHSLDDGTKAILSDLAAPVVIRYYATRNTDYMPEELKLHMRRVDDLLAEYQNLAGGKLKIENLDPEPDTDAEDAANLDGINGQQINDDNLYFGLAVSCLDRTETLPFLDPRDETMLEYNLSRAIASVSSTRKPTIGLMSALPVAGGAPTQPGQPPEQPWVIFNQLKQSYEVEDLTMTPGAIDPEKYSIVLLVHPAEITPEAEFALDQYVLQGGTVIACLDSFSVTAQMNGGGNPMMGQPGTPTSSTLPTLLKSWGVEMATNQSVGDNSYQTNMNGGRPGLAVLSVPEEGMPQKDSVATKGLNSLVFFLAGGMTKSGGAGVAMDTLVHTSQNSGLVDNLPASRLDPSLSTSFRPDDKVYDLVLHLHGSFKTAFPDGDPAEAKDKEEETGEKADDETPKEEEPVEAKSLAEATKEGNVFLISDVDMFYDQFCFAVQRLGNMQLAQPINGNSSLLFNLIDQAASSTHLIGSRSRAATSRPFTVFQEMEANANQQVGEKIAEFEKKAEEAQQRLNELQSQKSQGSQLYLTPEQEKEIQNVREQEVDARKQIRNLQKDLRREKDKIAGSITMWNIAGVPALILVLGGGLLIARRTSTRAR